MPLNFSFEHYNKEGGEIFNKTLTSSASDNSIVFDLPPEFIGYLKYAIIEAPDLTTDISFNFVIRVKGTSINAFAPAAQSDNQVVSIPTSDEFIAGRIMEGVISWTTAQAATFKVVLVVAHGK